MKQPISYKTYPCLFQSYGHGQDSKVLIDTVWHVTDADTSDGLLLPAYSGWVRMTFNSAVVEDTTSVISSNTWYIPEQYKEKEPVDYVFYSGVVLLVVFVLWYSVKWFFTREGKD